MVCAPARACTFQSINFPVCTGRRERQEKDGEEDEKNRGRLEERHLSGFAIQCLRGPWTVRAAPVSGGVERPTRPGPTRPFFIK